MRLRLHVPVYRGFRRVDQLEVADDYAIRLGHESGAATLDSDAMLREMARATGLTVVEVKSLWTADLLALALLGTPALKPRPETDTLPGFGKPGDPRTGEPRRKTR